MAVDRFIVSRSNYSIKTKHKTTSAGRIYERDYMTTTQNGSFHGDVFPFSENNFKMVRRMSSNGMRKHNFGEWLKQDVCVDGTNTGEYWTLNCISNDKYTTTRKIEIKPNFGSLLDFAYYGSCTELIKTSVSNILRNYPAELYVKDDVIYYYNKNLDETWYFGFDISNDITHANRWLSENGKSMLPSGVGQGVTRLVEISNPFNIDVFRKHVDASKDDEVNKLRYFCTSANKYDINNPDGTMMACACDWEVLYKKEGCYNGEFTGCVLINNSLRYPKNSAIKKFYIYEYYSDGEYFLLTDISYSGVSVRPTQTIIEQYFESLTDFEHLLLNRDSIPLYTCTIDYPHETEKGIMTYKKSFTWPTLYGWNLDIATTKYTEYINGLLDLAEFYDEGYTNNLWNMMTHDSIKNMDLTYTRANSTEDTDDYRIGTARMESVIMMYGRFFDEIKRSIDNIKSTNIITYNQYNNTPDYFLSDTLELSGWEVYSSINGLDTSAAMYSMTDDDKNKARKYTVNDADNEFMRNLKINSKFIFSRKGTRAGIESLLSLFGMTSYDFMKEWYEGLNVSARTDFVKAYNKRYNGTAPAEFDRLSGTSGNNFYNMFDYRITEYVDVASGGEKKLRYDASGNTVDFDVEKYNKMKDGFDPDGDSLQGLPCAFYPTKDKKSLYLVPWFSKLEEYDGNPYFQMYGGWGKMYKKYIEKKSLTSLEEIFSTQDRTVSAITISQYTLDDFAYGEYNFDVSVGDDYDYSANTESDDWQFIFLDSIGSGDTISIASAITSGDTVADSRVLVIGNDNKVAYAESGVESYQCNVSGATVIVSQKNYSEFIVTVNDRYDKTIKGLSLYDESFKYINIVRALSDLQSITLDRLHGNDIFYVFDLSEYEDKFGKQVMPDTSHYFILNDINSSYYFGENGWENIPNSDIEKGKDNGLRVLYLETLIDDNKGNAPHIGHGLYDDGEEYLNYFRELFHYSLKNESFNEDAYDCYTGELKVGEISEIGFDITRNVDNMKCWYFTNKSNNKIVYSLTEDKYGDGENGELLFTANGDRSVKVGKDADYNTTYSSDLVPNSFEPESFVTDPDKGKNDESAAYSIINNKKLRIQFNGKYVLGKVYRDYLYSSVLPYLKQIIPSTTLLEISMLGEEASLGKFEKGKAAGVAEDSFVLTNRYNAANQV